MSEWKEVWHVWDGEGEAPKHFTGILYASNLTNGTGGYTSPILGNLDYYLSYFDFENKGTANAIAYTTGQKRRRVECECCDGASKTVFLDFWVGNGAVFHRLVLCQLCNGKGYHWEYKK